MELNEIYRGRLIDHIQLVVSDITKSRQFYEAIFKVLNIPLVDAGEDFFWADEFVVTAKESAAAQGHLTGRTHIAFQAKDEDMVKAFYEAGMKNGGKDNGAPGSRDHYHPGYYAAFLLDPDGNNIEAVFHGKAKRSSEAIHISF